MSDSSRGPNPDYWRPGLPYLDKITSCRCPTARGW